VDGPGAALAGGGEDFFEAQITLRSGRATDADRFVGLHHMQGIRIGIGINGHRPDPEFFQGANNPARNGATIGDEHFLKHDRSSTFS